MWRWSLRMIGGSIVAPAVESQVRTQTSPTTAAALHAIAGDTRAWESDAANHFSSAPRSHANPAEQPMCRTMNSHDPVWMFAPSSPVAENAPANVNACGMTINAVNR